MTMSALFSWATDDLGMVRTDRCKAFATPMAAVRDGRVKQMIMVRKALSEPMIKVLILKRPLRRTSGCRSQEFLHDYHRSTFTFRRRMAEIAKVIGTFAVIC